MGIQGKVLKKLEFDKILDRLAAFCLLAQAKEMAHALLPAVHPEPVRQALEETEEGKEILRTSPMFSVRGARDIRAYLGRCERGGILNPEELLHIRDTVRAARQVRQALLEHKGDLPHLRELAMSIEPQRSLEDEISRCLTEDAMIADDASLLLIELRRSKARLAQRIRDSLEGVLRNPAYQKMLQDPLITQRADRYVIPIKQEYRAAFPGIVHDQSASGATLFIEPMPVVHLGNELREVILREQREVERILQALSGLVAASIAPLTRLGESLAKVDFILAKARLAGELNAGMPILADQPVVKLVQARHPLLSGNVVPLTVELGLGFDTLVITGPNTGGKTVALKTVGLLILMAQAGLHVPAEGNSRLGVFTQVFADIGDEQSVEQSLSTFSGHVRNIVEIVNTADDHSLVLLDEIGAGTDPTEGAALATAILTELHERGCRVVATTHYGALKAFAYRTPRVENASVDFDALTLRPTYRLLIGIPGKSNAFSIASRLGLSPRVLERAKALFSERETQVADLLENLEDAQRQIEWEKSKASDERRALEQQGQALDQRARELEERYELALAKARDEAAEVVRRAKREAESLIEELKESLKKEHKQQQDVEKARRRLQQLAGQMETEAPPLVGNGLRPEQVRPGQLVYMTKLRQKGQVLQAPNESGAVLVQVGILKVEVPLAELRPVHDEATPKPKATAGEGRIGRRKAEDLRHELDLRGMMVDEAAYALDKYLDDAVLAGITQIYVIHGKGTGALRAGVHDFLRRHPYVKSFRLGVHGEGDLGVTVVELK